GGSTKERMQVTTGSRLRVTLRPDKAVPGEVAVAAYRRQAGHALERWPQARPQRKDKGVFQLDALVSDLGLSAGRWELAFVIGREHHLPSDGLVEEVLSGRQPPSDRRWQVRAAFVDVEAP